jgi:hypothetical protein
VPHKTDRGGPAQLRALAAAIDDEQDHELRTLVTVSRNHQDDIKERQVFVKFDEDERVALRFSESFTRPIGPGSHRFRAHNTLFRKTIDFTVEPGEHLEFVIVNRGGRFTYTLAALLGSAPLYLTIYRRSLQ